LIEKYPALGPLLHLRDQLCLLLKTQAKQQGKVHIRRLLFLISHLQGQTVACLTNPLHNGPAASPRCERISENNGINDGFNRKMKLIQRHAYDFGNFNNYRHRVIAHFG